MDQDEKVFCYNALQIQQHLEQGIVLKPLMTALSFYSTFAFQQKSPT